MAKREREMKHQQFMEEKKRKQDEQNRQKQEEKVKKTQEVELKRQQVTLYKEQVKSHLPPTPVVRMGHVLLYGVVSLTLSPAHRC